ncbi:MAG: transposase [Rhizonema sp. PD38]|nr:transposase [Rhizonema sp. PD38]
MLTDWDAVVACFHNPQLPPINNEAERTLRHAVIARSISYVTRSTEDSSLTYCSVLSVIETCRLRKVNPWSYIAQVLTQTRRGIKNPHIPVVY